MRKLQHVIAAAAIGAALFTAGVALADNPGHPNNGHDTVTATTTTSTSTLPSTAKGYGFYCQWASKTHVAGKKGTPFSQCVVAMAKAAYGASGNAACAAMSKQHVAGQRGTPFSQCVAAAAKLHKNQH